MRHPVSDLVSGEVFGELLITGKRKRIPQGKANALVFEALCRCGESVWVIKSQIRSGGKTRCDRRKCWLRPVGLGTLLHSKEYRAWTAMNSRTSNPRCVEYINYGGRGVKVSTEFQDSFLLFLNYIGRAPTKGHSLDRIDVDGDYERGNIKWSTRLEQNNNRRTCGKDQRNINILNGLLGNTLPVIERVRGLGTPHELVGSITYRAWQNAKNRCFQKALPEYESYGGRGIYMSVEFQESFEVFLEHVGHRPDKGFSLDRLDNNKGYERGNLGWVTKKEQIANRRTVTSVRIEKERLMVLCDEQGISYEGLLK